MSRWIDKDKLNLFEEDGEVHRYCFPCIEIIKLIDEAPSIDIVRCKECKWYEPLDSSRPFYCSRGIWKVNADDFCSYGERRD